MLDVITLKAAVFEPSEVEILKAALGSACAHLGLPPGKHPQMALLVHNLGRSRLRLNRTLKTCSDLRDVVGEAIEIFTYMDREEIGAVAHDEPTEALSSNSITAVVMQTKAPGRLLAKKCGAAAI